PRRLMLAAFFWGAGVAAVAAALASVALDNVWQLWLDPRAADLLSSVVAAPILEEALKALFLLILLWRRRHHLGGVVDGIVYAGLVAVGFAFTENVLYLGHAFGAEGISGGLHLFILRCVFSPFAHPLFTAMTGLGIGLAARRPRGAVTVVAPVAGYVVAVVLHASWNGSSLLHDGSGFTAVYLLVMLPLLGALMVVVVLGRQREQTMLARQLPGIVAGGWIAPDELGAFATLSARRRWRRAARRNAGRSSARAVRRYQGAVSALAFLRDRMARGVARPDAAHWHAEAVAAVVARRAQALTAADPRADGAH
ncbi:MAG: PrsW family intramembrane metalloprotease, partial [Nocardioidaceae bacterium]